MSSPVHNFSVLQTIKHHTGDIISVDFGPNSLLCTGSGDKSIMVWEWRTGTGYVPTTYSPLLAHKYSVTCVRFSPPGTGRNLLASSSVDAYTMLWDVKTGLCLHSFMQSGGNGVRMCCFSTDATLLATAGEGGTLCLWDLSTYSLVRTIEGHDEESIQGVGFSPDGMLLVSGDVTGTYRVWEVAAIKEDREPCLTTVRDAHDLGINALEFSSHYNVLTNEGITERTYLMATCGNDHLVIVWQLSVTHQNKGDSSLMSCGADSVCTLRGHNSAVSALRVSPRGDLIASTSIDKTTRLWQISSGKCVRTLEGHARYVACCAFSRNQSLICTGSNDKTVRVWDTTGDLNINSHLVRSSSALSGRTEGIRARPGSETGVTLYQRLEQHSSGINSCDFSKDFIATAGSDHKIVVWDWSEEGLSEPRKLEGHRYSVNQVEFSRTGGSLASCSLDGTTLLWDPYEGEVTNSGFHVSANGVRCVRFSPDGTLLTAGGDDDNAHLFSVQTCDLLMRLEGHGEAVSCVGFSWDSAYIATGCADEHTRLYSASALSPNPILIIENCHDLGVNSLDFSPVTHTLPPGTEEKYELATGGHDCCVKVWKLEMADKTYSLIWKLSGHGGSVTCVRFSPNLAELIASTASDKTCRLWDSYSGDCLHVLNQHTGIVTCCAFSPDSTLLATGSMDKTLLVWELPKDLAFQSFVASRLKPEPNPVLSWSVEQVNSWLASLGAPPANIPGSQLLHAPVHHLITLLDIGDEELEEKVRTGVSGLREVDSRLDVPHDLLCPITHQLMRDPVSLNDGHTYERSAIEAWLGSGHVTSPMTNSILSGGALIEPDLKCKTRIADFLASLSSLSNAN